MPTPLPAYAVSQWLSDAWRLLRERGPGQVQFWFIALAIGIASGFAALFFRKGIDAMQATLYGTEDPIRLTQAAFELPWWQILTIPVAGGLVVGVILQRFTPDSRVRSVADVIEGAALKDGRVEISAGFAVSWVCTRRWSSRCSSSARWRLRRAGACFRPR